MKKVHAQLTLALLSFACGICQAASPVGCLIEPERVAEVGSQVIGVADKIMVERGDIVRKGQVLATLRSEIEQASVNAAKTRSQLIAEVKTAEANLELAKITEKRSESLVEKKFISQQALDKAHAETEVAKHRLTFSKEQLQVAESDLSVAKAQLNVRAIRAPFDGIVSDRYIWPGERVEEKPLFRIVKTNPLRVEMVAPVTLFGTIHKNDFVNIMPDMPNAQQIEAKITLVDKIIDGASNTFRIRAEIANPSYAIPSGLRCKADFGNTPEQASLNVPSSTYEQLNKKLPVDPAKQQPASSNKNTSNTATNQPQTSKPAPIKKSDGSSVHY